MSKSKFRSVEFWKEAIMTLPDNNFFELLRTVFGKIKTPFNKQVLMEKLEKFLLRDDIKKNIAAYIDGNDARIIAAVAVLDEPAPGNLETFFAGELSYSELHDLVVNLEERFILYRFFEKENSPGKSQKSGQREKHGQGRLALNPVLSSILSPFAAENSHLYPSVPAGEAARNDITSNKYLFDDRILAALLSFVSQNKVFFRAGGGIRQKTANAAETMFPGLPLETIIGGLRVLGLFIADGETLVPDYRRFSAFGALSRRERLEYCAAGIMCHTNSRESPDAFPSWLFRTKIRAYVEVINLLYNSLDPRRLYPHTTLQKLVFILGQNDVEHNAGAIIEAMEKTGLIVPAVSDAAALHAGKSSMYWRKAPCAESGQSKKDAVIVMDTPFTVLVYPEITYNDVICLTAFSNLIEAGTTVRFELSRDSVVAAFNRGFTANIIIELLLRLSHNRIGENVSFTLRDWEKRHGEITLRQGLVLTLAPEQRHLAETRPLARLIVETLAPGIYLLPESAEERAVQALHKAGTAIIARRGKCQLEDDDFGSEDSNPAGFSPKFFSGEKSYGGHQHYFQPLHAPAPHEDGKNPPCSPVDSSAPILIEGFHSILKQMRLGREEQDELSARIDRRLVLCESQLKDAVVRYEKLEARGLDYAGKALIAKQAAAMQSPVEVIWPGKQKQERVFGIPKALEKSGNESILIIDPADEGDTPAGTIRIPLGKISVLRRIKKSIFEGG